MEEISHEVMEVVAVEEEAVVTVVVIEGITKETREVVVAVEAAVVITKVAVTTVVVAAATIMQEVEARVRCRVITHKEVDIIRPGVIRRRVSNKASSNKAGVNKDGVVKDNNKAGELRDMDSGVMVNSRQPIQANRPRLTMQQHGELTIQVPGLLIGTSSTISNISSGTVSRLPDNTHNLVPLPALPPLVRQALEPRGLEHHKLLMGTLLIL